MSHEISLQDCPFLWNKFVSPANIRFLCRGPIDTKEPNISWGHEFIPEKGTILEGYLMTHGISGDTLIG